MTGGKLVQYQAEVAFLYRVADVLIIVAGLVVALVLYQVPWNTAYQVAATTAAMLLLFSFEIAGVYRPWRGAPLRQLAVRILVAWVGVATLLLFLAYVTKTTETYSRVVITGWLAAAPLLLIGWRLFIRAILRAARNNGYNSRRVAIVGVGEQANSIARVIGNNPDYGMHLSGFYCDDVDLHEGEMPGHNISGGIEALLNQAKSGEIDLVYIALSFREEQRIREILKSLADTTVSVYLVPDFFVSDMLRGSWVNLGELPTLSIYETPFYGVSGWVKRLEDILLASIILIIVSIPMAVIAAAIGLTSRGGVVFKQDRYGLDGGRISVWKFRTMIVSDNGAQVPQAQHNDPRVTPLGRFLRRTSLDELPQFINVLQGCMSVVGPRPHAVAHNELYRSRIEGYMLRHKIKPGITGWAQINGWRGETDTLDKMQHRVEHDLWYIRNWSILLDLKIVILTAWQSFVRPNAY